MHQDAGQRQRAMMNRREFLTTGAACAAALAAGRPAHGAGGVAVRRFSRTFAPHFGTFRHHAGADPIDQIKFLFDQGFTAVEDCGLRGKPPVLQSRIGEELARRGMSLGLFTGPADFGRPTFASGRADLRQDVLRELKESVEAACRAGGRFLSLVPGKIVPGMPAAVQMRHALDTLRFCADFCEPHGLVMVLEPIDHGPGASRLFLRQALQAAELCRRLNRPSCRLLVDVYQQAVSGGQAARLIEETADVLGYVQLGDAPGRKEPGSGHVDFRGLFAAIDAAGYRGILGMEHGNSQPGREGERAVLAAYAALDRAVYRPMA